MSKILITSTRWGHTSIAQAAGEVLESHHQVKLEHIEVESFSKTSYHLIYKFFPGFFRFVYFLSQYKIFRNIFNAYVEKDYKDKLKALIIKTKPDIVINVYFAFDSSLEYLRSKYGFRLINILADPWTFSKVLISENGENLTFDKYSLQKLHSLNPNAKSLAVGWFTEKKYRQVGSLDRKVLRKKLEMDPNMFTLCVVSGSEGTFHIFKIIRALLDRRNKMQVIILCGHNLEMFRIVKALKSISEKIRGPKITGIGFTDSMQLYLRAADLVVGKAGPNTMFQSVATLTPFFAISHITGQEDGNLDIIKRYGIGYVEENPNLATQKLKYIVKNPKVLAKFTKKLEELSKYCEGSEKNLLTLLAP
jgi:UDP-N-acetylglucosamine:LPS N-acetylglucosamine transferase